MNNEQFYIYGKLNQSEILKEYSGINSETADTIINNTDNTITTNVKKVPFELIIKDTRNPDFHQIYKYDGSGEAEIFLNDYVKQAELTKVAEMLRSEDFARAELVSTSESTNLLVFYNVAGEEISRVELSGFTQVQSNLAENNPASEAFVQNKSTKFLKNEGPKAPIPDDPDPDITYDGSVYATRKWVITNAGKIDKIKRNGILLPIEDKTVDIIVPNTYNDFNESTTDTYSSKYINNNFAPITFVSNLYASKVSDNTADLVNQAPALSADNVLVSTATTNTDYNWSSPDFTFTRDLEVSTTLTAQNSFALNLTFQTSRNATISWGAKIKVSQDNGQSWTYISDNQAYGAIFYETGIGNTAIFNVFTNKIQGTVTYPIGTLLAIEIYKKQTSATALTTTVYCGVEVDNAGIYTYAQFNFANVSIGTNQIEDGSVTKQKLEKSVQNTLDDVATIKGNYAKVNEENTFSEVQTFKSGLSDGANEITIKELVETKKSIPTVTLLW